ncbi:hypothetical protein [Flammeovirga aprica]|uniref:DUF4369 domain-containing protein n=1 Tax=Flammeovirga aprica JL-4 TaxID=694437 RepID=A0A7X9XB09_9BACT|nr:hypothetical protein [Flammeovirga aprica]NME70154.1 hypothetical protein [Flammeovirga aprica JL-4]
MKNQIIILALMLLTWNVSAQDIASQKKPKKLKEVKQAVTFHTDRYDLKIGKNGAFSSIKLANGKEILRADRTKSFYLNLPKGEVKFKKFYKKGDDFVFATEDESYMATFSIEAKPTYVAFTLKDFYGDMPDAGTMEFKVVVNHKDITGLPFDKRLKEKNRDYRPNVIFIFDQLRNRGKEETLSGFALYTYDKPKEEEESVMNAWVNEAIPHPVKGDWTYDRAVEWMQAEKKSQSGKKAVDILLHSISK